MSDFLSPHSLLIGATKGIGFALAERLGMSKHRVTLSGRTRESVDIALARLRASRPTDDFHGLTLDLKAYDSTRNSLAHFGPIDHLVLCGSSDAAWGPFDGMTMDVIEQALKTKLIGYLNVIQAVLPHLAGHGSITILGGTAARASMPGSVGIAAVNGALEAVTRSLARELAPRRVNLVSPGLTDTEAWDTMPVADKSNLYASFAAKLPARRVGRPGDSADAIAFMIANSYVTGSILDVDGGWHLG
jgi:NAD(P)-dependent dehydrogenase (short-subunit alcohol dehydrogenase family)